MVGGKRPFHVGPLEGELNLGCESPQSFWLRENMHQHDKHLSSGKSGHSLVGIWRMNSAWVNLRMQSLSASLPWSSLLAAVCSLAAPHGMPRHVWQAADGAYCNEWVPGRDHLWSPLEPTVQGQFDRPQRQQAGSVGTAATRAPSALGKGTSLASRG